VAFCAFCIGSALLGTGNIAQITAVTTCLQETFGLHRMLVSLLCAVIVGTMICGGIQKISRYLQVFTPFSR
jgi:Na+/alanine symporter